MVDGSFSQAHLLIFLAGLKLVHQRSASCPSERATRASGLSPICQGQLMHRSCTGLALFLLTSAGPPVFTLHSRGLNFSRGLLASFPAFSAIEYPGCTHPRYTIMSSLTTEKKGRCWSYMCPPLPQASLAHLRCFFCLLGSWVFARGVLFFHSHRFDFFYIFFDMHSINTLGHFGSLKNKVCID